jgi:hypothetical protein
MPDTSYSDATCPTGLQSCLPRATLQEDLSGTGDNPPVVVEEQTFCSASGTLAVGEPCDLNQCAPGAECIFERSVQGDLVSTLLSPYFGGAGQFPTCHAYCDPFDGDSAAYTCADGETCLVNWPWSAEVGHCAPIAEERAPLETCEQPGLACGVDSVCTFLEGRPTCLRLCDYEGGTAPETFRRSTCPDGLHCEPLVADVGVCRRPAP